ncbi:FtsJ-like methyltransferase-domain-containing protein [Scheffersomyces coipomensis]|uniref:FtsJ-like methyltransferase-domain-containing protein n=1 Tax=Scheffersomyces coipomensis TaxID=1788519 RepID=UPI00315D4250
MINHRLLLLKWPTTTLTFLRSVSISSRRPARGVSYGNNDVIPTLKYNKKLSRQQKIDQLNEKTQSKLVKLDHQFKIFHKDIKKVIDVGYMPGNWTQYCKFRLRQIHHLEEDKFQQKCHILGFDILFGTPPPGISTIQGNIFSKMAHKQILNHFKEIELRNISMNAIKYIKNSEDQDFQNSYFYKELNETLLEHEVERLESLVKGQNLHNQREIINKILKNVDYRTDLVLSDLSKPYLQQSGFYSQTYTRPYLRFNANSPLNRPITDPFKASIDLADAALMLACNALKPGATFVVRLNPIYAYDGELKLYQDKLEKVFNDVVAWHPDDEVVDDTEVREVFFICQNKKKDDDYDVDNIF